MDIERSRQNVKQLLAICAQATHIMVLMQDAPDPDALASASALRTLVRQCLGKRVTLGYGGVCARAENRAMMKELRIDAHQFTADDLTRFDTICLVDAQPRTGNTILRMRNPDIVIDHHLLPKRRRWRAALVDIRPEYGACSTIFYEYLLAAEVKADINLATALFYGIQSDTQDLGREASPAGIKAYQALFRIADKKKLVNIRRAPVSSNYFQALSEALANCVVTGKTVISYIPECRNPEMVAEVADLLIRLEKMRSAVCYGRCENFVHLSARAVDRRSNMAEKMKRVVSGLGTGGGHRVMAGGQIPLGENPEKRIKLLHARIVSIFGNEKPQIPLTSTLPTPSEAFSPVKKTLP